MVCSLSIFSSFHKSAPTLVHLPNGNTASVTHIGSIVLSPDLVLDNVLYVPSFTFNLISTSKLTSAGDIGLIFLSNKCLV